MENAMSIEQRTLQQIAFTLGMDAGSLKREHSFVADLGCDSLDSIELAMAVEDELGIELADEDLERCRTVGDLLALVARVAPEAA
jgi:acyl carrier protein